MAVSATTGSSITALFVAYTKRLLESGIDYMEVGYKTKAGLDDPAKVGPWRFCEENDLQQVVEKPIDFRSQPWWMWVELKRSKFQPRLTLPSMSSALRRMPTKWMRPMRLLNHCLEQGYETFVNVMAVSTLAPDAVDEFLTTLAGSGVHNVAIVDSFGALYPYHVRYLVHKYMNYLGENIKVGVHFHNNQQQAFANSIAAIDEGVDFVDATLARYFRSRQATVRWSSCSSISTTHDTMPAPSWTLSKSLLRCAMNCVGDTTCPTPSRESFNIHPRSAMERMARVDRYQVREMARPRHALRKPRATTKATAF